MLKNYFKIAWRSLTKNKTFSLINIIGLTVGLTCCLLLVLYIQRQTSFDSFHKNKDRIVRVIMEYGFNGNKPEKGNWTSTYVLERFASVFPEVESGVKIWTSPNVIKYGNKVFMENNILLADSTFFNVFSFPLISGNPAKALWNPNNIVLSETTAKKYFGNENPVGKTVLLGVKQSPFLVTGIAKDCPDNSQLKFDIIVPFSSLEATPGNGIKYFNANYTTYLLLKNKNSIASLQKKIEPFMQQELKNNKGVYINYYLEPLTKIHLHSPYDAIAPNVNIVYIYIISAVALLILLIACFTYINLSTVKSMERAKEVGIRKVAGAYKTQVFWQFITESFVLTIAAFLVSIVVTHWLLPLFNSFTQMQLTSANLLHPFVIISALALIISIALLAGSYPAFIVAKYQPVKVLKGSLKNTASGLWLRKSLLVFQFAISVFLVISTIIVQQQLSYIQHKKLGYDKEHVIVTQATRSMLNKMDLVKTELKTNPNIISISKASWEPVEVLSGGSIRRAEMPETAEMNINFGTIDEDYIPTCGLELVAGNNLSRQDILDANKDSNAYYHVILNETLCKALGWKSPQEAIRQKILFEGSQGEVSGVVKDFHFASLHNPIAPLAFIPANWGNTLLIKTSGNNLPQTINFIEKKYKELEPYYPFQYHFMDEDYQKLYASEMQTGKVFNLFSLIAVLLACLGLFGLSAYDIRQRTKEIGIRKVLGASVKQITLLLSGSTIKLVLLAIVIASPVAWWLGNKWLQGFAYRINISWWMFAAAAITVIAVALITVSFQSIKAATANPAKSIKTE